MAFANLCPKVTIPDNRSLTRSIHAKKISMEVLFQIVQVVTTGCMALIAGLFYAYSCSVNPGLGRLPDKEYLLAMQSINRAILNPWFFISFMGTLILMPVCTLLHYQTAGADLPFYLVLAATIVYAAGVFGVTIAGNVPLNNMLDKTNLQTGSMNEMRQTRVAFEIPWNRFHRIRTVCNIIALVLLLTSIIKR